MKPPPLIKKKEIMELEVIEAQLPGVPAVDVMVPTYNRLDLTVRCIQSIYLHTQSPFHVIVCDASDDGVTPAYFKTLLAKGVAPLGKVANLTYIHKNTPWTEGNEFFNVALKYVKSEYMATVMNSTRVEPEWEIAALTNIMPNHPEIGILGFKCLFSENMPNGGKIESAGIRMLKWLPTDLGRDLPGHRCCGMYETDAVQWAFCLTRVKAIKGNLPEGVFHGHKGWDDIDNCFCVKEKGWKILYCGLGAGYHEPRATRGNNSDTATTQNKENGMAFYKRWQAPGVPATEGHSYWDEYLKENPGATDIHALPKGVAGVA